MELATPSRRIAAYVLDAAIGSLILAPFLFGMTLTGEFDDDSFDLVSFYAWGLPPYLLMFGGIIYLEGERGYTPGKRLLGIRVVDKETREPIGWRRALVRRLMFVVEALVLGYLLMFWDKNRQALHDKPARSIVTLV